MLHARRSRTSCFWCDIPPWILILSYPPSTEVSYWFIIILLSHHFITHSLITFFFILTVTSLLVPAIRCILSLRIKLRIAFSQHLSFFLYNTHVSLPYDSVGTSAALCHASSMQLRHRQLCYRKQYAFPCLLHLDLLFLLSVLPKYTTYDKINFRHAKFQLSKSSNFVCCLLFTHNIRVLYMQIELHLYVNVTKIFLRYFWCQ